MKQESFGEGIVNSNSKLLPKLKGYNCFACGTANPIGLNLHFYINGDSVCADIVLGKNYEGWENVAHGGIVSTLLDEVMSWTIMYSKKVFLVTRNMSIKYIRPVPIGIPLTVIGKFMDDSEPPKIKAKAEIRDGQKRLLVRSSAEFVAVHKEKLSSVPDRLKEDMLLLFDRLSGP
ncbi:MAG: PaaI family thioesterase [Pseudomonadota bacterium]